VTKKRKAVKATQAEEKKDDDDLGWTDDDEKGLDEILPVDIEPESPPAVEEKQVVIPDEKDLSRLPGKMRKFITDK
jgi:hypothetical protein